MDPTIPLALAVAVLGFALSFRASGVGRGGRSPLLLVPIACFFVVLAVLEPADRYPSLFFALLAVGLLLRSRRPSGGGPDDLHHRDPTGV